MNLEDFIAEQMRDPEFARHWRKATRRIERRDRLMNLWLRIRARLT